MESKVFPQANAKLGEPILAHFPSRKLMTFQSKGRGTPFNVTELLVCRAEVNMELCFFKKNYTPKEPLQDPTLLLINLMTEMYCVIKWISNFYDYCKKKLKMKSIQSQSDEAISKLFFFIFKSKKHASLLLTYTQNGSFIFIYTGGKR